MGQTVCFGTSAYKIQMQGNYPEESMQHSEHGESLKSRILLTVAISFDNRMRLDIHPPYGWPHLPTMEFCISSQLLH
jgi:hypothetical protein